MMRSDTFLPLFFFKTVKKMVCFPSVLKCLKLLKSENLLCEHKHKCAHTGNGREL